MSLQLRSEDDLVKYLLSLSDGEFKGCLSRLVVSEKEILLNRKRNYLKNEEVTHLFNFLKKYGCSFIKQVDKIRPPLNKELENTLFELDDILNWLGESVENTIFIKLAAKV